MSSESRLTPHNQTLQSDVESNNLNERHARKPRADNITKFDSESSDNQGQCHSDHVQDQCEPLLNHKQKIERFLRAVEKLEVEISLILLPTECSDGRKAAQ